MVSKELGLVAVAAILIASTMVASALAEMQILESNVSQFQVGTFFADTADMRLPAGGRVKVLLLPANETKVFEGAAPRNMKNIPFGASRKLSTKPQN